MRKDVRALSDEELIGRCEAGLLDGPEPKFRKTPGRAILWSLSWLAIVGPLMALLFWFELPGCVGIPPVILIIGLLIWGVRRSRRPYWRELQRRYAGLPIGEYVRELESDSDGRAGSHVLLVNSLAGGGNRHYQYRATVGRAGGFIELRTLAPRGLPEVNEKIAVTKRRVALTAEEHARLVEVVGMLAALPEAVDVGPAVICGNPVALMLWEKGQGAMTIAQCNYIPEIFPEFSDFDASHPVVRALEAVFDAGGRLSAREL